MCNKGLCDGEKDGEPAVHGWRVSYRVDAVEDLLVEVGVKVPCKPSQ